MKTSNFRDIVISIGVIVYVLVYAVYSLAPIVTPQWYYQQMNQGYALGYPPQIYADCQIRNETASLFITVTNSEQEELNEVVCSIEENGGMIPDEDTKTISSLGVMSSDVCSFNLNGKYESPLKIAVKSGDKSVTQAVNCYPAAVY